MDGSKEWQILDPEKDQQSVVPREDLPGTFRVRMSGFLQPTQLKAQQPRKPPILSSVYFDTAKNGVHLTLTKINSSNDLMF